jgi:hypothetical protein
MICATFNFTSTEVRRGTLAKVVKLDCLKNKTIIILDIILRPALYLKHKVSGTAFYFRLQAYLLIRAKSTELIPPSGG